MRTADAAKKSAILGSARRLLVRRGFQDVTMDEVAREAGVAKGTLFLYYASKDALFSAAFAELVDQLGVRLDGLLASELRGRALLEAAARAILEHHDRNRDFLAQFGAGRFPACGPRSAERLMDRFRENGRRVRRILKRCSEDGLLPAGDFHYETAALFGLCRSAMMAKLMRRSARPVASQAGRVARFFLGGARAAALALALALCAAARAQEAPPPAEADLVQCYEWAQAQSESLHMQAEQIFQLEQQFKSALASALPVVSFNASDKWLDAKGAAGGGVTAATPQPQVNFALTQPLFTGLREFAAMSAAKSLRRGAELQLTRARSLLYQDVSNAFYLVASLESQLANTRSAVELTTSRIKELRERESVGRSRHSEVVLVESQEAALQAAAEGVSGQIAVARELLSFLTGQDLAGARLVDRLERLRAVDGEESYLQRAYDRSDVLALRKQLAAQQDAVRIAKGAWLPTVSFSGNYYLKRQTSLDPIKWDAGVFASLPIFSGGGQLAAVRQAKSQVSQAQYSFELGLRQARTQIRGAYAGLRAAVATANANEKAYLKADESYRLNSREYRSGLVSNLDVLSALNSMVGAKTAFDSSVVQTKLSLLQLKAACEQLP